LNILVILNGISRKKKKFYDEILPALGKKFQVTVSETTHAGHAFELAKEAIDKNFDCILSAGGDGTLHQVINGISSNGDQQKIPIIGVIPLGSGNDFATACGLTIDANSIVQLLQENKPKPTDVGKVNCFNEKGDKVEKYFINVCSVGMGPATVKRMEQNPKWMSSDMRYFVSILQTFFSNRPEPLEVRSEHWNWKGSARVFAIANGKSFGNKIYIAPDALPDDGLFNSFLVGDLPLIQFLLHLQKVKAKKKVKSKSITYSTGKWFELHSSRQMALEAEGELAGYLPARIELVEKAILFLR
jgi:YegS/Rv2252/BmrU family lipid kinase